MPTKTFNFGKDCQLVFFAPTGQRVDLSIVTDFDAKQETHSLRVKPLNGPPQGADLPGGWNFSFKIERGSSAVDDLFSQMEQDFWSGGVMGTGQVFQYVNERDGSQSTYQFDGVTVKLTDAGSWKADSAVQQSIDGFASTRKRI